MLRWIGIVFLIVVALVGVALVTLASPIGHAIVASLIERYGSTGGVTVTVDGVGGVPPFSLSAEKVEIADADGIFATIENLAVDPGLVGLIGGTIALDALSAERVTVLRRPNLPPSEGGSGALVAFVARQFTIVRLDLAEPVAGPAAALSVSGSASAGSAGAITANIRAERVDGVPGSLVAQISRAGSAAWPTVDIELKEAANGLLAGFAGRSNGPAYALSVKAGPAGDTMRGTANLASDGAAQFNGAFEIADGEDARRIALRGSGDLAELLPETLADLLAGSIDIALDADFAGAPARPELSIRRGTVRTASLDGEISGRIGAEVADLTFSLDVANPADPAISLPLSGRVATIASANLRGTVAPADGKARLDMVGRITGLAVDDIAIPGTGISAAIESSMANPFAGAMPFALRLEADEIRTATGTLTATPDTPLVVTAEGTYNADTMTADVTADIRAAGGTASFVGTVAAEEGQGTVEARFADLTTLAGIVGRDLGGSADITAEGTLFGPDGTALDLRAALADFRPGIATLDRLLGGATTVGARLTSNAGTLGLADLTIAGTGLQASGDATIAADRIEASLEGTISDLAMLADRSSGTATFSATASGALPYPDIDATIEVANGSLLDQSIEGASVRVQAAPSDAGATGSLTLDGSLAGKPLTGTADFALTRADGGIALPSVDLTIADNRITGALQRAGGGTLSGELAVDAPNLQALSALALAEASGAANARIRFAPDGDRQSIAVSFDASGVSFNTLSAQSATGEVSIADAFGTPLVNGNATIDDVLVGSVRLDRVTANAAVSGGATRFDVTARGPDLDLTGRGELTATGERVLRIDQLSGSAYRLPITLAEPAVVQLDAQGGPTARAALSIGSGRVVVEGKVSAPLDLRITATNVPASVANTFAPNLGAAGTVNANATFTGEPAAPRIRWQATWSGLEVAATRNAGLPALTLAATGDATRSSTSLQGTLTGAGLSLDLGGSAPFAGDGLNITVRGRAPLALLALRSNRELRLNGNADLDLRVTGSARAPAVNGAINLADATAVDVDSGFGVAGASGRVTLNGKTATVERISGRLAQGGQLSVTGTVDIGSPQFPGRLTIEVRDGRYNDGRMVNTTFNANLDLNGPLTGGAVLSGNVALGRTEIQLPDRLAGKQTAIDVEHVNVERGFSPPIKPQPAAASEREGGSGTLRLDVDLRNTGGIFVRGFGVDAEFGGQLKLTNTIANPTAAGAFTMTRGRIEVLGRRFELVSGLLTFSGDLVPVVDFVASTSATGTTIQVSVTGRADDPIIAFSSNPDLPDEEILSRLLFDRGVGRLSAVQAAQLVDAAAQLSGVGGGQGIFASVRNALGVDDLDIRQDASGGATVGIGKRINENLRLGVEAGSGSSSGRVTIDLDITPELKLRGGAGQGGTGELGLSYEREY